MKAKKTTVVKYKGKPVAKLTKSKTLKFKTSKAR